MDQESDNRGCTAEPARNKSYDSIVNLKNYRAENHSDQEPAKASGGGQDESPLASVVAWSLITCDHCHVSRKSETHAWLAEGDVSTGATATTAGFLLRKNATSVAATAATPIPP